MKSYRLFVLLPLFFVSSVINADNRIDALEEYQRQVEIYNQQAKKAEEQYLETDRQLRGAATLQSETNRQLQVSAKQQEIVANQLKKAAILSGRMERLLERWEKQADRFDMILDKWEKQESKAAQLCYIIRCLTSHFLPAMPEPVNRFASRRLVGTAIGEI